MITKQLIAVTKELTAIAKELTEIQDQFSLVSKALTRRLHDQEAVPAQCVGVALEFTAVTSSVSWPSLELSAVREE